MNDRIDGRAPNQLRPVSFETGFTKHAEGSVLVSFGETKVLCNVSMDDYVPKWIANSGKSHGWVTGEYAMLPRSTHTRINRETKGLKGRTQEIQRLVGRSLRAAVNLEELGERSCIVDCDVLQADGGTRTAAITGGYVALKLALLPLVKSGEIPASVFRTDIAAISVGIVNGQAMLDLCYHEDSNAETDMNIVMTGEGKFIELQGTAEQEAFDHGELLSLLSVGKEGINELFKKQNEALEL